MKAKTYKWLVPAVLLALVMTCSAYAQSSTSFSVKWSSINSGGGQGMSSSSFKLNGTLGQSVAGTAASTSYKAYIGFWVPEGASTPVAIDSLDEAKSLADGTPVSVTGKTATTDMNDFGGFFYIQEVNRSSGIRVVSSSISGTLARGKTVSLEGKMGTTAAGEREIVDAVVTVSETVNLIAPAGMNNKTLGGGDFGNASGGLGQYGVIGGAGTNNIGLLIKAWGQVTESGTGYVTIDDGSGVSVRVDTTGLAIQPSGYATVTGISSLYGSEGSATRLILAID